MQITALGHAAALVNLDSGGRILLDPWLEDPAYFQSWWHFPPLAHRVKDLAPIHAVYLSHDHPDHCDPKTLTKLPRETEIWIPRFASKSLDRILSTLGFSNVRHMRFREPFEWRGARIECLRTDLPWDDSSLLVTDGDTTVFDMNDCKLEDATLDSIGRDYEIDVALVPYSGAIQFPTCYEMPAARKLELCAARRAGHLRFFADRVERLRARFGVPFAAGYCLPSPEQWWMNDVNNINSPAQAKAALEARAPRGHDGKPTVCLDMNPGDTWDSHRSEDATFGLTRLHPPPDWSRHFELVREHARSIQAEVRAARENERMPEPGLDERFVARFRALMEEQPRLARESKTRVQFDARGPEGFLGFVDTTRESPVVGLGAVADPNLTIRIPTAMLDALLAGRVTWDEVLISFRLWFEESPPVYHEPWWALLHSSNRLDPAHYLTLGSKP